MVIEHTFITTLEAEHALGTVAQFLVDRGFAVQPQTAFAPIGVGGGMIGQAPRVLELTRGKTNPARAKGIDDLPQRVRVEWDRGRVSIAASVAPKNEKTVRKTPVLVGPESADLATLRAAGVMGCLLLTITQVTEILLAYHNPQQAVATWNLLEAGLARRAEVRRKRARRNFISVMIVLGVLIAVLIGAFISFSR